jgi:uncharacterized protein YukE
MVTAPPPGDDGGTASGTPVAALAPFSRDWIGGDISGLSSLAATLYGYVPGINGVMAALSGKVNGFVGSCLWTGPASAAFESAYDEDAKAARGFAVLVEDAGEVIDALAVALSKIESDLEQAAAKAESHGAPIGPDGRPAQECLDGSTKAAKEAALWLQWYQEYYQLCIDAAQKVRDRAAADLGHLPLPEVSKNGSGGNWEATLEALANDLVNTAGIGQAGLDGIGRATDAASQLLKPGDLDTMYALSHNSTLGTLADLGESGANALAGSLLLGAGAVLGGIGVYQQTHNATEAAVDGAGDAGWSAGTTVVGRAVGTGLTAGSGAEDGGAMGGELGSLIEPGGGTVIGAGLGAVIGAGVGLVTSGDVNSFLNQWFS